MVIALRNGHGDLMVMDSLQMWQVAINGDPDVQRQSVIVPPHDYPAHGTGRGAIRVFWDYVTTAGKYAGHVPPVKRIRKPCSGNKIWD